MFKSFSAKLPLCTIYVIDASNLAIRDSAITALLLASLAALHILVYWIGSKAVRLAGVFFMVFLLLVLALERIALYLPIQQLSNITK